MRLHFRQGAASFEHATRLFLTIAAEHRHWPGRDKALFSAAMAQVKLGESREHGKPSSCIREGVLLFERMIVEHPQSSLAKSAAAAAAGYWRRNYKSLFE
jgi:hypothetical protein